MQIKMEQPDKWVILKITKDENILYKVFVSWHESWRINSGIKAVEDCDTHLNFIGYSGSCYQCIKGTYGLSLYSQSILNNIIENALNNNILVEILPEDTDFKNLLNNI
jgi:hypothetical protein